MGEALEIRRASPRDRDEVLGLWLALIEHHRQLDPIYPRAERLRGSLATEITRGLAQDACRLLVADVGDRLAGFLFAELEHPADPAVREPQRCWIHELWVSPQDRRRGIGSALLAEADVFFHARGARRVVVRVESRNGEALRFWERRAFKERSRVLERDES